MRLTRLLATTAVVAGSIVGFAAPASADTLCEQAWLRGDLVAPTNLGECFPYNSPWCLYEHGGTGLGIDLYTYVCAPEVPVTP